MRRRVFFKRDFFVKEKKKTEIRDRKEEKQTATETVFSFTTQYLELFAFITFHYTNEKEKLELT
jgi:hypothetical protein